MSANKKGTSLVELLAVIVIMGIIAAIAVPTVGALLKNTRQKAAVSDVTTVIQSIDTYLAGASEADKTNILGIDGSNKFTINFGADGSNSIISEIFDTDTETVNKISGSITFKTNASKTKIDEVEIDADTTYTKEAGKVYKFTNATSKKVSDLKAREQ